MTIDLKAMAQQNLESMRKLSEAGVCKGIFDTFRCPDGTLTAVEWRTPTERSIPIEKKIAIIDGYECEAWVNTEKLPNGTLPGSAAFLGTFWTQREGREPSDPHYAEKYRENLEEVTTKLYARGLELKSSSPGHLCFERNEDEDG